jgi:two-component system phosphate regulon sensor histidine kinase PhoR
VKLTQRILLGTGAVVGFLVLFIVLLVDRQLRDHLHAETIAALAREARVVAAHWTPGIAPSELAHRDGTALGHRVTLVAPDGTVVGDSDFEPAQLATLENHAARPEVAAARDFGLGSAERKSPSNGDNEFYVAIRTPTGTARISMSARTYYDSLNASRSQVELAGVAALAVALLLSLALARNIARPVIELREVANALSAGDFSRRPLLSGPEEIADLGAAMRHLAEQLEARIEALRTDETLLVQLTEALDQGVITIDASRRVVRLNETGRRLLAVRDPLPFPLEHLPRKRELHDALGAALRGESTDGVEVAIGEFTIALTARPLASGGAVVALFDLTRVRQLEAVRRDFVANVSHELRTPLTIIGGFAETLVHDDPPDEQRRQFADRILTNTRRMRRIVDDLLDLSRIETGGWVPNSHPLDLATIATDTLGAARDAIAAKPVALETDIADDARILTADETALRQILGNLVENAIRHTAMGSITIFARRRDDRIEVGVRDSGSGIPAEHLPRIFERFYRADPGRSRFEGGTGLGLSIVKHMVEAHGGSVVAESVVGVGTTISAYFPAGLPGSISQV